MLKQLVFKIQIDLITVHNIWNSFVCVYTGSHCGYETRVIVLTSLVGL